MRTFAPVSLVNEFPANTVTGQCDQCGDGATSEQRAQNPNLYEVELVGTVYDHYGNAGLDEKGAGLGFLCRTCYERSKERTFAIWMHNGDDIMCEVDTLDAAMRDIASYLDDPDEYARYAPFRITAQRDGVDVENIATITMGAEDVKRSNTLHGRD